jgi:peptide/nickel transport system ATP-binding protein
MNDLPEHPEAGSALLEVDRLSKRFSTRGPFSWGRRREVQALDEVSFKLWPGETLGLVGESGCGKSTLARCLVRLHDSTSGKLRFEGQDITRLSGDALRAIRPRIQMVFQDPYTSLNPRRRVGDLIAEPLRVHTRQTPAEVAERVRELTAMVGLRTDQLDRYPHEFSGGQRQRIGIARALALQPRLIVADEPVSALDVSIQAQIVNLLADLQERLGLTYVFIAHDLSVVRQVSTRTAVMVLGSIVESGPTDTLYDRPAHPYTAALIAAVPMPRVSRGGQRAPSLLRGDPPDPSDPPGGCRFHPRCPSATDVCRAVRPPMQSPSAGHWVACHHPLA